MYGAISFKRAVDSNAEIPYAKVRIYSCERAAQIKSNDKPCAYRIECGEWGGFEYSGIPLRRVNVCATRVRFNGCCSNNNKTSSPVALLSQIIHKYRRRLDGCFNGCLHFRYRIEFNLKPTHFACTIYILVVLFSTPYTHIR